MKNAIIAIIAVTILSATGRDAQASHRVVLYQAANAYRDAVREFERQVLRLHYMEREDERLVDDLEDHTSVLRSASRHPENSSRFADAWVKTQLLQSHVEAVIFGRACYPRNPVLERAWHAVIDQYLIMAEQIECMHLHPRNTHRGSIYYQTPPIVPSVYPRGTSVFTIPRPASAHRHSVHEKPGSHRFAASEREMSTSHRKRSAVGTSSRISVGSSLTGTIGIPGLPTRSVVAPSRSFSLPSSSLGASFLGGTSINRSRMLIGANLSRMTR